MVSEKGNRLGASYGGDPDSILKGRNSEKLYGKGSRTIVSDGEKFNINSHIGRREAYFAVCKERGIGVDYKMLADSVASNKYLSGDKGRQNEVSDYVISEGILEKGEGYWCGHFSGSEGREVVSQLDSLEQYYQHKNNWSTQRQKQ